MYLLPCLFFFYLRVTVGIILVQEALIASLESKFDAKIFLSLIFFSQRCHNILKTIPRSKRNKNKFRTKHITYLLLAYVPGQDELKT